MTLSEHKDPRSDHWIHHALRLRPPSGSNVAPCGRLCVISATRPQQVAVICEYSDQNSQFRLGKKGGLVHREMNILYGSIWIHDGFVGKK